VETREEFLAYRQTSPQIYAWLPYHRDEAGHTAPAADAAVPADAEPPTQV
jgi:hypothetical protein